MKNRGEGLVELMIVIATISILMAVVLPSCNVIDTGAKVANEVTEETMNGKNAIAVYERFKRLEEGIRAKYRQEEIAKNSIQEFISMLPEDKAKWTAEDKGEIQRLRMIKDGIAYSVDEMIKDYNAESKMVNKAVFKDNLPTNIFRGVNTTLDFKYSKKLDILPTSNN